MGHLGCLYVRYFGLISINPKSSVPYSLLYFSTCVQPVCSLAQLDLMYLNVPAPGLQSNLTLANCPL